MSTMLGTRLGTQLGTYLGTDDVGAWFATLPGRIADFDPSDPTLVTLAGSSVTALASSVGGHVVSQGTGINQPTWSATSINGRPGITCSGTQWLVGAAGLAAALAGTAPYSLYAIVALTDATGDKTFFSLADTNTVRPWIRTGTGIASYQRSPSLLAGAVAIPSTDSDYCDVFSGTSFSSFVNGVVSVNNQATTASVTVERCIYGGSPVGGGTIGQGWIGRIGRVVLFDRAHGAAERAIARAYLRAQYGL